MRAWIVVDLGFGDSGKGLLTDCLVRRTGAGTVVRYNGGAQAGHNVVTPEGIHHTFSQFGAGTFVPGVRTFLSKYVVIHPTALIVEYGALNAKGIADAFERLRISDLARVITPYHQAANRLREIARGLGRHGSCGIGLGEAVRDAIDFPDDTVRAGDLADAGGLRRKLKRVRERKRDELAGPCRDYAGDPRVRTEFALFDNPSAPDAWIDSASRLVEAGLVVPDSQFEDWVGDSPAVIFEGAQGVLIDEDFGFHPYTTWSRCTSVNAEALIAEHLTGAATTKIGVLRSYAVRHGPGPLPTETDSLASAIADHNADGEWQGPVRYGWFDGVLARYALEAAGGVDRLVVTHMDVPPRSGAWRVCAEYSIRSGHDLFPGKDIRPGGRVANLPRIPPEKIDRRLQLTQALFAAEPAFEPCGTDEPTVLRAIEGCLHRPVDAVSRGPRDGDVEFFEGL